MTSGTIIALKNYTKYNGPLVMVVMDGLGIGKQDESDGVYVSHTPVLDNLMANNRICNLKAHGKAVGLPTDGDMGNSEVGHNALGAGRIFSQGAKLVNEALDDGSAFEGKSWKKFEQMCDTGGTLHFIGLLSDGNVHSNIAQLFCMLERCCQQKIEKVRVHALLDGRDVGPKSALTYAQMLEEKLESFRKEGLDYRVASGGGRMVTTMDRYNANWDVVEKGWQAHVLGEGRQFDSLEQAVSTMYEEDPEMTDQYMDAFVIVEGGVPVGTVEDGDGVIFFNFRGDRAIEISRAFEEQDFTEFERKRFPDIFYAGLMQYDGDAHIPKNYLVEPPAIENTLGENLCHAKISSYAISETQKFGHVTYFWNGNRSGYIDDSLELYEEVPSDKLAFDLRPWMKAAQITDKVIECIKEGERKFIRLNYANCDMVGHTGNPAAVRIAVETVDLCLKRLLAAVKKAGGIAVITADHGNADCMWKEKDGIKTPMVAHTLNPVPFIIVNHSGSVQVEGIENIEEPGLANVAATLMNLLGLEAPAAYEPSLIKISSKE